MVCYVEVYFFFFKQKTAYELRISDWSSDVCSSDLRQGTRAGGHRRGRARPRHPRPAAGDQPRPADGGRRLRAPHRPDRAQWRHGRGAVAGVAGRGRAAQPDPADAEDRDRRSEEHTSELQSLMRISYAVFCLKKKKKTALHTIYKPVTVKKETH